MDGRPHPAPAGWRLSLVLPAYNEEAGIRQAVAEADEALAALAEDYEILVVDDGSRDGTAAVVAEEAAGRPHVRLLRHETNRGYGSALRTGFEAARLDRVAFTDADCQFYLADLARLLPLTDRCPLAAGYREARQDPWHRCFLSRGYNLLTRALLGTRVRDCDCALKVFRRDALAALLPETNGFFVNAEMLARARQQGYEVAEAGVRHRPRLRGASKVSLGDVPRTLATLLPFWWSRVLFRADLDPGTKDEGRRTKPESFVLRTSYLALCLAVAAVLFFTRLRAPLLMPEETRYAEVPRQMLAAGRWLVPVLHGQAYLDKPPLLYWLVMGSYRLFGVHDWAARLVPGLAGVLTVLVVYLWGRRTVGGRAGLLGALMLCLSAQFVYRQRMLTTDGVLGLWVAAGLAAAHVAMLGRTLRRGWWLLAGAACGLGLLTKGPVALVLLGVPVLAYQVLEPRAARVTGRGWAAFLAVALGLAGPWYAAIQVAAPDFAGYFLWKHNVVRFLTPFNHAGPPWFYLPGLLLGMLPWTLLLPGLFRCLRKHSVRTAARRPPALGFFLLAFLGGLVFFSLAGSKRPLYALPLMPPLALALGCYLDVLLPRTSPSPDFLVLWRRGSRLAFRATLLVLLLGLGATLLASRRQLLSPAAGVVLGEAAVAALAGMLVRRRASWAACGTATFVVLFLGVQQLQSAYNRQFSLRGQLRQSYADLSVKEGAPVVCYPQRWDSVSFYLPRAEVRVYTLEQRGQLLRDLQSRPETLLIVKAGAVLDDLLRSLPPTLEFVPSGRPGPVVAGCIRVLSLRDK